jgi:uncharacterized membrane protein
MSKLEYLELLKRAMLGLPPDVQAKTLGYYEQRFVDGIVAGRSEQDVARELDDPKKIAMTLRANSYSAQFGAQLSAAEKRSPANAVRILVSGVGLAIFNLFMIVPAMVYSALLFSLYVAALAFYLGGVAITASGLAGNGDILFDLPTRYVQVDEDYRGGNQVRVQIDETGIHVHEDTPAHTETGAPDRLRITTDMDADSRTTQTVFGFGMVLGGIALFLLSLIVTRYTVVGIKRYVQMNFSLLKGH